MKLSPFLCLPVPAGDPPPRQPHQEWSGERPRKAAARRRHFANLTPEQRAAWIERLSRSR